MIQRWSPGVVSPPVGQYSHLAGVPAGHELVFVSGQIGAGPDGVLPPDAEAQSRLAHENLATLLTAAGGGPEHLVKMFTMVAGAEHLGAVRAGRGPLFERWFPNGDWPAHSLIVVAALATPEIIVEVEAVAAIPR